MELEKRGDEIDAGAFWTALGARPVGATVITAPGRDGPEGFLGQSFAHVAASPPTVLVSVGASTTALAAIRASGVFAANVLPVGLETAARAFGGKVPPEARFEGLAHRPFVTGAPVLDAATAVFDCEVIREIEEAGVAILLARVAGLRVREGADALVAVRGGYAAL